MRRYGWATIALGVVAATAAVPGLSTEPVVHFALSKSVPAEDTQVAPPTELLLWFTEVPQENSIGVRLVDPAGEPVETGDVVQNEEDPLAFSLPVAGPVGQGVYVVAWRGIGPDGHPVRGDFSFTVVAE